MPFTPTPRSPSGFPPEGLAFSARTDNEYHTAMSDPSWDPQHEALNSTANFDPSQASGEMSIELGRGVKRSARDDTLSEDNIYTFGSDQQYEFTNTPPMKPSRQSSARKNESGLRREASVRRASEITKANGSAKRTTSLGGKRQSSLADVLRDGGNNSVHEDDTVQHTVTVPSRNTRFAAVRNVSGANPARVLSGSTLEGSRDDPKHPILGNKNAMAHETESFMIPDIDGATALFGTTPTMTRSSKKQSRFTPSAAYKMPSRSNVTEHHALNDVPIPEDAKMVYKGLQEARDRITELELEKEEQLNAQDEYENLVTNLRTQLEIERHANRPDSGLGSEEEGSGERRRRERAQLQAQVKALQTRAVKAERQATSHEATVKRVTAERAEIYSQAEAAISELEEIKVENDQFREGYAKLQDDNEDLKEEVALLREENEGLRALATRSKKDTKVMQAPIKEVEDLTLETQKKKKQRKASRASKTQDQTEDSIVVHKTETGSRRFSFSQLDEKARDSIAQTVQTELKRIQRTASEKARASLADRIASGAGTSRQSSTATQLHHRLSKDIGRRHSSTSQSRRAVSAPVESSASEADSEDEPELTARTRTTLHDLKLPLPSKPRSAKDDTADLTQLSNDTFDVSTLRKALEEQRRPNRATRHSSAPVEPEPRLQNAGQTPFRRKSSLKDITAGLQIDHTGKVSLGGKGGEDSVRLPKTVRVQSPHLSDTTIPSTPTRSIHANAGADTDPTHSLDSTTSTRRRNRNSGTPGPDTRDSEGETSAFILPDITFHAPLSIPSTAPSTKTAGPSIPHDKNACTVCATSTSHIGIPLPLPPSSRSDLGEDATLRPAWPPHLALAHVVKQVSDEVTHLRLALKGKQDEFNSLDFSVGRSQRLALSAEIADLGKRIDERAEMLYRLHDVVEAHKTAFLEGRGARKSRGNGEREEGSDGEEGLSELEETLQEVGMDPVELAGRLGRSVPEGLREEFEEESQELPWEGLSDGE